MGFKDFGLMVPAQAHMFLEPSAPQYHFAYFDLIEDIPYSDGAELQAVYDEAVLADEMQIDMSHPRSYWSEDTTEGSALWRALETDARALKRMTPDTVGVIEGVGRYYVFVL